MHLLLAQARDVVQAHQLLPDQALRIERALIDPLYLERVISLGMVHYLALSEALSELLVFES